ncbi:DNA adenine methylase [Natrinema ejinorense]|uniref:site-specific DNA-methyltransferase (adenine-specific) n=1 Tax=Natrinema ejinorense TaxID=373386 RepID=A0A2A5QU65_9EURY|nr:DNA adenine methylase [Natrinema ejinorense]PCR90323.1 adenine methyltransferase [Natrinema ejinorense]
MISAFPYIGGKTRLAEWVIDHLPEHTAYVEPFGGSASVLLNKPRSNVEVFNDKDSDVVTFFRVARERPDELAEWCRYTPFSEQLHDEWADEFFAGERPSDDIEHAGKWLFLRYSQYAGKVSRKSGFKRESPLDEKGSRNARNWVNAPERIQQVAERFRGVSVVHEDFQSVVSRYDSPETAFYLDPPYYEKEDLYRASADHATLEETLCEIDGYAIVSYTDIPPGLYEGNEWHVVERTVTHSAAGNGKTADERLILNFEPSTERAFNQRTLADVRSTGGESA